MSDPITMHQQKKKYLVVGLGITGLSCVRFLKKHGHEVTVMDSRAHPPGEAELKQYGADVVLHTGIFSDALIEQAEEIILSPGIPLSNPCFQRALARGQSIVGDIELFCRHAKAPIIAITGANAKSTVTDLMATVIAQSGLRVAMGGNIGVPALDLLDQPWPDYYALELSSFQLETTYSLSARVACILNITPDHMDRYDSLQAYQYAKQRIYQGCEIAVFNRDDLLTKPLNAVTSVSFTAGRPAVGEWGLRQQAGEWYFAHGEICVMPVKTLALIGKHNQLNALAVLAMASALHIPLSVLEKTFATYPGLPHRCQKIGEYAEVAWYDDSKGTNVGATQAAIEGLGSSIQGRIILIAGGVGKDADFSLLADPIHRYVRKTILIGQDGPIIAACLAEKQFVYAATLTEAVQQAYRLAQPGDAVLLSPACASFDMFKSFVHRGEMFQQAFLQLQEADDEKKT